eukprot:1562862-Karenia_brevis.AAC.1
MPASGGLALVERFGVVAPRIFLPRRPSRPPADTTDNELHRYLLSSQLECCQNLSLRSFHGYTWGLL